MRISAKTLILATSRIAAFLVSLTSFEKLLKFAGNLSD